MRKKLLFCSALLLSASLAGCGYNDDNVRETVPALPESCSSTNECFVGSTGGVCVEGHCLRACEDRTDCEDGTICESGICRHIVPCPTMDFKDDYRKFQNSKCLKVFSHTPSTNWVSLLNSDLRIQSVSGRLASTNFTSNNFTFQIPTRSLQGGLNYSMVVASALTFIILENMASTLLMQCMFPKIGEMTNTDKLNYSINMDSSKQLSLTDGSLFTICTEIYDKSIWDDFNDVCAKNYVSTGNFKFYDRFNAKERDAIRLAQINYVDTLANTQLLMNNLDQQIAELDPDNECKGESLKKEECTDLLKRKTSLNDQIKLLQARLKDNTPKYEITSRCDDALLAWKTLEKVYKVVSEATLQAGQENRSTTNYVIRWVTQLLEDGTVSSLPEIKANNVSSANGKYTFSQNDIKAELTLDLVDQCSDIETNIKDIHKNICNNIMAGISDNPMVNILSKSSMDLVTCLTEPGTGKSLVENGFRLVGNFKFEETLPGIAQTLMAVLASGDAELASNFQSMSGMVNAIGDPTLIWLTEGNLQELNILSNQTSNNPFKQNTLMLGINYTSPAEAITRNKTVDLNVYDAKSVMYSPSPELNENAAIIGTQQYKNEKDTAHVASLLSESNNGKYEFYFNPTGKNLTCGGVVLDISAIDGYVVLTDDQINSMNGTSLIVETPK